MVVLAHLSHTLASLTKKPLSQSEINQYFFGKCTKQLFDLCLSSPLRVWSSWSVTSCWPWEPVYGSEEAAVMENLAQPLDLSWLVSRGTSARSESSHSATDRRNTRYMSDVVKSDVLENQHKITDDQVQLLKPARNRLKLMKRNYWRN